jgi:hypothetical protein
MNNKKLTIKKSISIPSWLLELARKRASEEHRSLSSYIQFLIASDSKKEAERANFSPTA